MRAGARAVILSPSRELALQTHKVVKELGRYTDLRTAVLVGGDSMEAQVWYPPSARRTHTVEVVVNWHRCWELFCVCSRVAIALEAAQPCTLETSEPRTSA